MTTVFKSKAQQATQTTEGIKKPRRYWVVLHNDNYTTQDFVVHVLQKYLGKSQTEAVELMLRVHTKGKAQVALYSKDVAESKVDTITRYARQREMPLVITAEPEEKE